MGRGHCLVLAVFEDVSRIGFREGFKATMGALGIVFIPFIQLQQGGSFSLSDDLLLVSVG